VKRERAEEAERFAQAIADRNEAERQEKELNANKIAWQRESDKVTRPAKIRNRLRQIKERGDWKD